jgi:hypothetical protein
MSMDAVQFLQSPCPLPTVNGTSVRAWLMDGLLAQLGGDQSGSLIEADEMPYLTAAIATYDAVFAEQHSDLIDAYATALVALQATDPDTQWEAEGALDAARAVLVEAYAPYAEDAWKEVISTLNSTTH